MATANEQLLDRYVRHQTYILRYAGGLRNSGIEKLSKTERRLRDLILSQASRAPGRSLASLRGRKWASDLEKAIRELRSPAWTAIYDEMHEQLKEFTVNEARAAAVAIEAYTPVVLGLTLPPANQLISIVNSQPFEGRTLKEWMRRTDIADVQRILTAAKIGVTQGLTPTQVARSVIGTGAFNYRDGVMRTSFRDLETVTLTVTNGLQQEAKQALYRENSDVIQKEQFVATLDARTTLVCAGNDGETFSIGEGPIPPLHHRCRSTRVPFVSPEIASRRPAVASTERQLLQEYTDQSNIGGVSKRDSLPRGHKTAFDKFARKRKRELTGTVPAKKSYNEWLKEQSKSFQDDVLGPTRARLFRQGDVTLDKFTARDGDVLTLNQLKSKGLAVNDD